MRANGLIVFVYVSAAVVTLASAVTGDWAVPFAGGVLASAALCLAVWARQSEWRLAPVAALMAIAAAEGPLQVVTGMSAAPMATLAKSACWFTLASLFAAASAWLCAEKDRSLLLRLFAAGASLLAAFVLVQPYAGHLGLTAVASSADAMVGPFQNRNTYASFVELAFPVAVWAARRFGPEWWLPSGILLASSLTTGSRAGAALAVAEAVLLAIWMRNRASVAILTATAVAGLAWGGGMLSSRLGYRDPLNHRGEIYASALDLVRARPVFGWGLGTFEMAYPAQARFDVGKTINYVHNDWLETAVEGGLPFAALVGGTMALLLWRSRHSVWAIGLPVVVVHSLVDFPFQRLGVLVWFFLIAAAAEANYRSPIKKNRATKDPVSVLRLRTRQAAPVGLSY